MFPAPALVRWAPAWQHAADAAPCGNACVVTAWLDKRDFLAGYDVYAAISPDGGRSFGRNIKVQDSFGDNVSQWHASAAGNTAGRIVAVWNDNRDGTPDVWLSDWDGTQFSDNVGVPGAAVPGTQTDPVILPRKTLIYSVSSFP